MNKEDLQFGNVVETRERFKYLYIVNKNYYIGCLISLDKKDFYLNISSYRNDLTYDHAALHHLDIMKVYKDYTLKELLWKRKEKPKLTEDEKVILRDIGKEYRWIARTKDGVLYVYEDYRDVRFNTYLNAFNHLFQFIKWEDDEPYSIAELLKENN